MSAATLAPGAKSTAETAELRNAEGKRGARNCGITAERLRKHSQVSESSPSVDLAPALVRPGRRGKARETIAASPPYARGEGLQVHEQAVVDAALAILAARLRQPGAAFDNPTTVKDFLTLHLVGRTREAIGVVYLDQQHCLIAFEVPFEGTLNCTQVYPREIARRALQLNAAAVILSHNHPSGVAEPSRADEFVTTAVKVALQAVSVILLDHIIVGARGTMSFAERGFF